MIKCLRRDWWFVRCSHKEDYSVTVRLNSVSYGDWWLFWDNNTNLSNSCSNYIHINQTRISPSSTISSNNIQTQVFHIWRNQLNIIRWKLLWDSYTPTQTHTHIKTEYRALCWRLENILTHNDHTHTHHPQYAQPRRPWPISMSDAILFDSARSFSSRSRRSFWIPYLC